MPSRTHLICLHEGKMGRSIDPIFIRTLLKALDPAWIRPWTGNNIIRTYACGGNKNQISRFSASLHSDAFGEVAGLVNVAAAGDGDVVGK